MAAVAVARKKLDLCRFRRAQPVEESLAERATDKLLPRRVSTRSGSLHLRPIRASELASRAPRHRVRFLISAGLFVRRRDLWAAGEPRRRAARNCGLAADEK